MLRESFKGNYSLSQPGPGLKTFNNHKNMMILFYENPSALIYNLMIMTKLNKNLQCKVRKKKTGGDNKLKDKDKQNVDLSSFISGTETEKQSRVKTENRDNCSAHSILTSVRKTQFEVTMDKNLPDASTTNRKLVVLTLGLLCILQAALNISLRLALYSSDAPDYDVVIRNLTEERDKLRRKLKTSDSSDAPDNDAVIRNLKEERDRLKKKMNIFDHYTQEGWVYFRSSFFFISSDTKSWADSRDDCLQKGADLVIINSKEENEFIRQFRRLFWIGLTDKETEGTWKWVDGTLLSTTTSYWHPGEPNSYQNTDEDCGETKFNDLEYNWNDKDCNKLISWICEKMEA